MERFDFYSPTKILFGKGREAEVGAQVTAFGGTKVLVVYGGKSARESGLIDRVESSLAEAGVEYLSLGGVQPNPRLSLAREMVAKGIAFGADMVLAVGGGSVIDTAKGAAHGIANPETDLWDFWMGKAKLTKTLPIGVVLTISAAGSELSDSAVLTDEATHAKRGLNTDLQRPRFAIMNPELTYTLPKYQVACGVVDMLMHTLERYFNPVTCNFLTDEIAESVMRTVVHYGPTTVADSHDYQAMSEIMWASSLSHNNLTGLGNVKDFTCHQLGHELGGMFDVAHGASLSAVWASWARYCLSVNPARFARLGEKVFGLAPTGEVYADANAAIDAAEAFFAALDMPTCLEDLGIGEVTEEVLEKLADGFTRGRTRTFGQFKNLDYEDALTIYTMAKG